MPTTSNIVDAITNEQTTATSRPLTSTTGSMESIELNESETEALVAALTPATAPTDLFDMAIEPETTETIGLEGSLDVASAEPDVITSDSS